MKALRIKMPVSVRGAFLARKHLAPLLEVEREGWNNEFSRPSRTSIPEPIAPSDVLGVYRLTLGHKKGIAALAALVNHYRETGKLNLESKFSEKAALLHEKA